MRYLKGFLAAGLVACAASFLFASTASAGEELNEFIQQICDKTPASCDGEQRQNTLSHEAINKRINRASAVGMATDFHRADEDQDNHLIFNLANFDFEDTATAFGVGYLRDFSGGWSAGASLATDVNAKDQAVKATVGFSW